LGAAVDEARLSALNAKLEVFNVSALKTTLLAFVIS
jgi:hypothetical protein